MNVLILGGTRFLGRHLVNELLARSHEVTLFNSGAHSQNAPPQVDQIHGKRESDLARLGNHTWHAVIDTCGFFPKQLETSARFLQNKTSRYVFISSISALDLTQDSANERTPTLAMPDGANRSEMVPETYGALKALCESVVTSTFRNRALIARPGLIVGPYDPTDRFTYWPSRVARGGTVLAPGGPDYFVQFIDARDLAAWVILQIERGTGGEFNLTGPPARFTLGDVLLTSARVANVHPEIRWVDEASLKAHEIGPWIDMPLWITSDAGLPALRNVDVRRAFETGLQIRPLAQTVRDTLQWAKGRGLRYEWKAGLSPEREAEVLSKLA